MSIPITEKLIQRQINHWNGLRRYLQADPPQPPPQRPPIITISRQAGSGGRALAQGLSKRLNLPVHDQSLVEQVMRQENLPPALAAELDEKIASQTSLWIKGLFNRRIFLVREYEVALSRAINAMSAAIGGIFLGRGAHLVLADRADLRIRLVAPVATRRARLAKRLELSQTAARALVRETDEIRAEFLAKVFGEKAQEKTPFDLTINTDRMGTTAVTELALLAWVIASSRPSPDNQRPAAAVG